MGTLVASPLDSGRLDLSPLGTPVELVGGLEERLPVPSGARVGSLAVIPDERDPELVGPGSPVSGYSDELLGIPVPLEASGTLPVGAEAVVFEPAEWDSEVDPGVPDAVEAPEVTVESPPAPGVVDVSFPLSLLL